MTLETHKFKKLLTALPALKKIYNSETLLSYFSNEINAFLLQNDYETNETKLLLSAIYEEAQRLYGPQTALQVVKQIHFLPIMESGTHLAFLRDYDSPQKDETRSLLNQNILISASLMKQIGAKYHIGFYGSNVSLTHPCGAGYYQLGEDVFPVTSNSQLSKGILFQSEKISPDYFNETVLISAQLNLLKKVLDTLLKQENLLHKEKYQKANEIVSHLLKSNNLKALNASFSALKKGKKALIQEALQELNTAAKKLFGQSFKEIEQEYKELKNAFERKDLKTLSDQTALIQTVTLNKIFKETGILHVSLDATEISRKFFIKALEDQNSLWFKVFSNPHTFKKFHQALTGIRAAWKENESPFIGIAQEKNVKKSFPIKLEKLSHDPKTLVTLLKQKQIAPSSSLICLAAQSANILAHGGFFQSTYAEKMKQAFQGFLAQINEHNLKNKLNNMPVDLMFLSLGVVANNNTKKPLKLSEISKLPAERLKQAISVIPKISAPKSVLLTAPILNVYLNETAPGYIENEVKHNQALPLKTIKTKTFYPSIYHAQTQLEKGTIS